jgi:hypothetical protein
MPSRRRRSDDDAPRVTPRQRRKAESQLRTGGRHCPVCLTVLPSIAGRSGRRCTACGAEPRTDVRCAKCHGAAAWEGRTAAGCALCGHHGSKVQVFAGSEWLEDSGGG